MARISQNVFGFLLICVSLSVPASMAVSLQQKAEAKRLDNLAFAMALADALNLVTIDADTAFASARTTKHSSSFPDVEIWDTRIGFTSTGGKNCTGWVPTALDNLRRSPYLVCEILSPRNESEGRALFDDFYRKLLQLLPADWMDVAKRVGGLVQPTILDNNTYSLTFRAPQGDGLSVTLSLSTGAADGLISERSLKLFIRSKDSCRSCTGQPLSEARVTSQRSARIISFPDPGRATDVPSADIRSVESNSDYKVRRLHAEMLESLERCKDAVDAYEAIGDRTSGQFCREQMKKAADDVKKFPDTDRIVDNSLYTLGRYDDALARVIVVIQEMREAKAAPNLASDYLLRARIEAAMGALEPALKDYTQSALLLHDDALWNDLIDFDQAIVLYLYGREADGKRFCARAARRRAFAKRLCDEMEEAGQAIAYFEANAAVTNENSNLISLENPSSLDVVVKVIGPSTKSFTLPKGQDASMKVGPGEYKVLLRYGERADQYLYAKGGPFQVNQTPSQHSEVKITIPTAPKDSVEAKKEFNLLAIPESDRPTATASRSESKFVFGSALTGPGGEVESVAFSPDSRWLVTGIRESGSTPRDWVDTVRLWEVATGREVWSAVKNVGSNHGTFSGQMQVVFSPDGRLLAIAAGHVDLLDPATGKTLHRLGGIREDGCACIAFSPDGRSLASGDGEKLQVWDVTTARTLYSVASKNDPITSIAFSPDGRWLVSGGNKVKLWDAASGKPVKTLDGGASFVTFSPDKRLLATISSEVVNLWDLTTASIEPKTFSNAIYAGHTAAFSEDSHWLASASEGDNGAVTVWDLATRQAVATLGSHSGSLASIAFSPDGQWLAWGDWKDIVWLWRRTNR
jgi:WD40 repeat protein